MSLRRRNRETEKSRQPTRLKERRRRSLLFRMGFLAIVFLVFAVFLFWFVRRPIFRIDSVIVEGRASTTTVSDVATGVLQSGRFLSLLPNDIRFFYPKELISAAVLKAVPSIGAVLPRVVGNTLHLTLEERAPYGLWCPTASDSGCLFIDETGLLFSNASSRSVPPFVVFRGYFSDPSPEGAVYLPEQFNAVKFFIDSLNADGFPVRQFEVKPSGEYEIILNQGTTLLLSPRYELGEALQNFRTAVTRGVFGDSGKDLKRVKSVDLRFRNKLFYN